MPTCTDNWQSPPRVSLRVGPGSSGEVVGLVVPQGRTESGRKALLVVQILISVAENVKAQLRGRVRAPLPPVTGLNLTAAYSANSDQELNYPERATF